MRKTQYASPEVICRRQWDRIEELLHHAARTVPFWKARFEQMGLTPQAIRSWDDFHRLPFTTKDDLRANGPELRSTNCPTRQLHHKKTSGSTGVPVEVYVDDAAQQFQRACTLRSDEWSGWRLGERVAAVWGNPDYLKRGWRGWLRNTFLDRMTFLDTLNMDENAMLAFAQKLQREQPPLLFGHAHSLFLFAEFLRNRNVTDIRPKGIISTAMVLHDWERQTIREVFNCSVINRYGCEEVSLIACECDRQEGLHVNADGIYLEILRPDGTLCEPGETGSIIVTDLVNRAMPIIRYRVGDAAAWAERPCSCGRTLPLLSRIEGRVADYVVTPKGEWISGISLTENFAVLVPGIAQLQIVQEKVDFFTFRIVRSAEFGQQSQNRIRDLVAERFGSEVRHRCEFVDRIPQEPSGKYRFCISKVEKSSRRAGFARQSPVAS
jgi:phenylacetate-CoA ligase